MNDPLMDVPEPARSEMLQALAAVLAPAKPTLETNGAVLPTAAEVRADGAVETVMTGLVEAQDPATSREVLREWFRRRAAEGAIRCAAIAYDSQTLQPDADVAVTAVCVHVEHADGYSVDTFTPFKKGWFNTYSYRPSFVLEAPSRIFPPPASAETTQD